VALVSFHIISTMRQKSMTFISSQFILQKHKIIYIYIPFLTNFYEPKEKTQVHPTTQK